MSLTDQDLEEFLAQTQAMVRKVSPIVKYYTRNGKKIDAKGVAAEGVGGLIEWQNQFEKTIENKVKSRIADLKRAKKTELIAHTFMYISPLQSFISSLISSLKTVYLCIEEQWRALLLDLVKGSGISLQQSKKLFIFTTVTVDIGTHSTYGRIYYSTQEFI